MSTTPWQWYPELERIWKKAGHNEFTMTFVGFSSTMVLVRLEGKKLVRRVKKPARGPIVWVLTKKGVDACVSKFGPENNQEAIV